MTVYVAKSERAIYNPKERMAYPNVIAARKAIYSWVRSNPYKPAYFFTKRDSFTLYGEMTCHSSGRSKEIVWFRCYGINMLHNPESTGMSEDVGFVLPSGRLTRTRPSKV